MASLLEQADNDFTRVAAKCAAETRLEPAIEIMAKLSELFYTPVILAGGAVRDAMLERPLKDYDFFVSEIDATQSDLSNFFTTLMIHPSLVQTIQPNYQGQETLIGREVKSITSWEDPETFTPCQLIELRGSEPLSAERSVNRFDIGLCQCALSVTRSQDDVGAVAMRGAFHFTDAFWADVNNRTMTYTRSPVEEDQVARSKKRFDRLSQKYPGYSFVIPT